MLTWEIEELKLDLIVNWKISRNQAREKVNYLVKVRLDQFIGVGEAAPNVRYNETPKVIYDSFESFKKGVDQVQLDMTSFESLTELLEELSLPIWI